MFFQKMASSNPFSEGAAINVSKIRKNSLKKIKFLGGIFLGHKGPRRQDIPDPGPGMSRTKTLCKAPFPVVLDSEMARMSRDLGQESDSGRPGIWGSRLGSQKELYARILWADLSFPLTYFFMAKYSLAIPPVRQRSHNPPQVKKSRRSVQGSLRGSRRTFNKDSKTHLRSQKTDEAGTEFFILWMGFPWLLSNLGLLEPRQVRERQGRDRKLWRGEKHTINPRVVLDPPHP